METLDLDINNYNINDLEKFFGLKSKSTYKASDIDLKECQIRETLLNSGHINKRFKANLIEFLNLAKKWLIFVKCPAEKPPTTIPKNYRLDPYDTPRLNETIPREAELVPRQETQFIYTNPSDFFPGKINPLNTRVITKCLNIDTRFRKNLYTTQSSDFTIQIPTKFNKVVSMQLSAIELPISFYGISSNYGNNYLYIKVKYIVSSHLRHKIQEQCDDCEIERKPMECEQIFTVPDGNYTANDLIDTLNYILSPKKLDQSIDDPDNIYSYIQFSIDITENGSGSRKVSLGPILNDVVCIEEIIMDFTKNIDGHPDTTNISTKIGWNLGFTKPVYCNESFYTAETMVEPTTKYIYLAVDDFNNSANNQFVSAFDESVLHTDILARISIKGSFISIITENDFNLVTEPRHYFGPVDIQRLRIRLFDEYGRVLSMNNSNYSFCLTLKMLYDL